ncbi:citrate/2-methylcitrate synthase [Paeniglutamicibacter cryotolerans]|uniref:citrate/2-methylcitrate synthase n=1 Tax=Paeniglutamicibacter cryotolerans TaxID=670079 RepID=UPI0016083049|nr:citrate/2-methylcitrate synthase [Paeniglutamicibacter cryotolerans]
MSAALDAFGGPFHRSASIEARRLIEDALERPVEQAVSLHLARTGTLTAFGHPICEGTDPRVDMLLSLLEQMPGADADSTAVRQLTGTVG